MNHNKFIEILKETFNPVAFCDISSIESYGEFEIREDDRSSNAKPYKITGLDKEFSIVLKLENIPCPNKSTTICSLKNTLFNKNKTELFEMCDYLIFTLHKNRMYCIFLENKSENPKNKKVKNQIEKSRLFWDYSVELMKYYSNINFDEIKYIYLFSNSKQSTKKAYKKKNFLNIFGNKKLITIPQDRTVFCKLVKFSE